MFAAVVPVRNEEKSLKKTLATIQAIPCDLIVPVINGSIDDSCNIVLRFCSPRIFPIFFKEALGIDVPRAVGARAARDKGAAAVVFIDGDMTGDIGENIEELLHKIKSGCDMALTDCYPGENETGLSPLAASVMQIRRELNRELGLENTIGGASPSHGPHAVSRRLLLTVPLRELAVPPVSLGLAVKNSLQVGIGTSVPHKALGSPEKGPLHSELIAKTIIGDCLEALCVFRGEKRSRSLGPVNYHGYHILRRWDLLDEFLARP